MVQQNGSDNLYEYESFGNRRDLVMPRNRR